MAKYEFFGSGCGSGTSYTVIKDGAGWGTQQPRCPDVNLYFKNYYPNDEVWVNGVLVSTPAPITPPVTLISCSEYKIQMGIGSSATYDQAIQASVDYFAGIIDKACAIEIVESMNPATRPGRTNTLATGGLIAAGLIFGALIYKKIRRK